MQVISSDKSIVRFDQNNEPAAVVKAGESVKLCCRDCFGDAYFKAGAVESEITYNNPCTGPVFIEEALPGDTLVVEIEAMETADTGIVEIVPEAGPLGRYIKHKTIKKLPIRQEKVGFSNKLFLPVKPMIGVLGVTPLGAAIPTVDLGNHGGNLDCNSIAPGAKVLFPVAVKGALLAAGDFHAVMGDGELGVSGLEVAGSCILKLNIIKNFQVEGPVIFYDDGLEVVAAASTLDEAVSEATRRLYRILHTYTTTSAEDISALISLAADAKICQTVNSQMSARIRIPLSFTPELKAFIL